MKVKLTTLFLCILFLWGSVNAYGQQTYSSNTHQIKAATESVDVAIAPTFAFEERELIHFPLTILVNLANAKAYVWQRKLIYLSPFYP